MKGAIIVGSISLDTNLLNARPVRKLGGVGTYGGLTFCRHGLATTVVTGIAAHDRARLDALRHAGLNVVMQVGTASTVFVNEVKDDDRIQRVTSIAEPIRKQSLPVNLAEESVVMIGALHPDDLEDETLDALMALKGRIAADVQGYLRHIDHQAVVPGASSRLQRVLAAAKYVKADTVEMEVVTRSLACSESDLVERYAIDELVVTDGSRGGRIVGRRGSVTPYAAVPTAAIDPTGAGDVFFAAYLWSRVIRGSAIDAAAAHAAEVAASHVAGRYISESLLQLV